MDSDTRTLKNNELDNVHAIKTSKKIVIVDPRTCYVESLLQNIQTLHKDCTVITFKSISEFTNDSSLLKFDISTVILSIDMTGIAELQSNIAKIKSAFPKVLYLVLTSDHPCAEFAERVCELDVCGLIPSYYNTTQFIACLKTIEAGVKFIPTEIITQQLKSSSLLPNQISMQNLSALKNTLTPRQIQVLTYLCVGRSNKYIAIELDLCESTVKVHVSEIMRRLGATSRTHASYIFNTMLDINPD